jgi:para-nitrobenzyl esterase
VALQWVRDNIEYFGGNSNNITIAGNSAGGSAVCTLMNIPQAKGLFQKAICESGSGGTNETDSKFEITRKSSIALLSELGIDEMDVESLKKIPLKILKKKILKLFIEEGKQNKEFMFGPIVDGNIVIDDSLKLVQNGNSLNIPLLIGTTMDEFAVYSYPQEKESVSDYFLKRQEKFFNKINVNSDKKEDIFSKYKEFTQNLSPDKINRYLNLIWADIKFRLKSHRFAEFHSKFQKNTYVYVFNYENLTYGVSQHASEIPFIFGNLEDGGGYGISNTEIERKISSTFMDAWINFIKNGNPNSESLPDWLPYNSESRNLMLLGIKSSLKENYFTELHKLWDNLI